MSNNKYQLTSVEHKTSITKRGDSLTIKDQKTAAADIEYAGPILKKTSKKKSSSKAIVVGSENKKNRKEGQPGMETLMH
jgi:hypothetical protein